MRPPQFRRARTILSRTSAIIDRWRPVQDGFRVHVVCYEPVDAWILGKFALRLSENLTKLGVEVDISKKPDAKADINHHIIYYHYDGRKLTTETVMITHVDTAPKLQRIKEQLENTAFGICTSRDTVNKLAAQGVPRNRLCFVNPASDGIMVPRRLLIGITSKVQPSGCKREQMLVELARTISPDDFELQIMGPGWDSIIDGLRRDGFCVDYVDRFDRERYRTMMPMLDYYLYLGEDEGSMGFIDALAAGIPTIVTPQGFHLDVPAGITHAFSSSEELAEIFRKIADERNERVRSVESWTWLEYARKHLTLWQWILAKKKAIPVDAKMLADLQAMAVQLEPDQ